MLIINKRVMTTKDRMDKEVEEAEEETGIIEAEILTDQDHVHMEEVINYWL